MKKHYAYTYHYLLRAILLLVVSVCGLVCSAQTLMQKTTKAGRPSMMFSSVIAEEDGYVITGVTTNPTPPYYIRSVIGKMDMQGNFTSVNYMYDSIAKNYGTFFNCLNATSNGYRYTGYTHDSIPRLLLVEVDHNFNTEIYEYGNMDWFAYKGHHHLEIDSFKYIAGVITVSGKPDVALIKLNQTNNILWQRTYGLTAFGEAARSFIKLSNGNLMIGSERQDAVLGNEKSNTWLLEVDTAGDLVRQWFDPNDSTYGAYGLRQTADGGFYYASQKKYEQTVTDARPVGTIVRMDNQFNKLWEYEGDRSSPYTGLYDIEQMYDVGFVACGSRHIYNGDSSIVSAWITKVHLGYEMWSREFSGSTAPNTRIF